MRALTMAYGWALTSLGVGGYVASGRSSRTALIPAAFGIPLVGLGFAAGVPGLRRVALGGAVTLAAVGAAATVRSLGKIPEVIDGRAERPLAVASQSAMAVLSLAYLSVAGPALVRG